MNKIYCPKCKSKLYPIDKEYMEKYGHCSYCQTFFGNKKKGGDTCKT